MRILRIDNNLEKAGDSLNIFVAQKELDLKQPMKIQVVRQDQIRHGSSVFTP